MIFIEVIEDARYLNSLELSSKNGTMIVSGNYDVGRFRLAKFFKLETVDFKVELKPIWVRNNHVRFKILRHTISNPLAKKIDLVALLSHIDPFHKAFLLDVIVNEFPYLLSLTKLKNEIRLDLNYFLNKFSGYTGNLDIRRVEAKEDRISFLLRFHPVIASFVEFFGADVVVVEEANPFGKSG
jgi:hypothetical protein